ncbi:MAG: hypothetical protein M3429_06860, partial [Verrucomicrobiota bacterium]|nr:hypothetical protein [Verrucomicrobiota bacterium]
NSPRLPNFRVLAFSAPVSNSPNLSNQFQFFSVSAFQLFKSANETLVDPELRQRQRKRRRKGKR